MKLGYEEKDAEISEDEYAKLISFLSIAFTHPEKLELDDKGALNKESQQEFYEPFLWRFCKLVLLQIY